MAITDASFDSERELEDWIRQNIGAFIPGAIFIKGFQVLTTTGKLGIPDGFAFDFAAREWYVVECELLAHGVWPHIAEQIVRFVVAMQNPESRRRVRDKIFEHILAADHLSAVVAREFETVPERLLQQVELFIESVPPQMAIFIDATNQDLHDMAHALAAPSRIFRVQKFLVNGQAEYHSPDRHVPAIATEPESDIAEGGNEFDVVEALGGGKLERSIRRFRCYRLSDNSLVHIKRSKLHERSQNYWYGISQSALEYIDELGVTHIVFVMGDVGFAKVPMDLVRRFLKDTLVSRNADGSVRHYHCYISNEAPDPRLYVTSDRPSYSLTECFHSFG